MKKYIYKIIGALISIVGLPLLVYAINITVPSAPGAGYMLISTSTGAYIATTTDPAHFGSVFATSSTATNYFQGKVQIATSTAGCAQFSSTGVIFSNGSVCPTGGFAFPFATSPNYNSTTTVIGFLGGLFSTASSTFNNAFRLPSLSSGQLNLDTNGLVYSGATTTFSSPLSYSNGAVTCPTCNVSAATVTSVGASTPNSTLSLGGTNPVTTSGTISFDLNLGHANTWTALQSFFGGASSTVESANSAFFGGTGTTSINIAGKTMIATSTTYLNSALSVTGTTTVVGQITSTFASTTGGSTSPFTVDWSKGNTQRYTLTANSAFIINATSSNPVDGGKYVLKLCQDGTGSRTVTFATPQFSWYNGTTTATTTPRIANWIGMVFDAREGTYNVLASTTVPCIP